MIKTLLSMHKIKYIISVDDCYSAPKKDDMISKVLSEMCDSVEPFKEYISSIGKEDLLAEIETLSVIGADKNYLIKDFINGIPEHNLAKLFEIANKNQLYASEQSGILTFLEELKKDGSIERYLTFPSTSEAVKLDYSTAGIADGGILWLLDRNFERVGESTEAGIQLAQTIVERHPKQNHYVYILSAVEQDSDISEDDIESEFDKVLSANCNLQTSSFVYYINKQRIFSNNKKKIAKSLAQGFKRKVCYELFQIYGDCLSASIVASSNIIFGIKQKTLNYLFAQKVDDLGESRIDFIARLVRIFQSDEYNKSLAAHHEAIANKMSYYEELCYTVKDMIGDSNEVTPILKEFREIELFNKHINSQHLEISTGDVFKIKNSYYLLISQACDIFLRKDGCRKLNFASLLQIEQNGTTDNSYRLSCFRDYRTPTVMYQQQLNVPFDILDLCVLNNDGQACIDSDYIQNDKQIHLPGYTKNFSYRLQNILKHLKCMHEHQTVIDGYMAKDSDISNEKVRLAYEALRDEETITKQYEMMSDLFRYPVQRICRLDELTTVDIINQYSISLSRIGHPFDFAKV